VLTIQELQIWKRRTRTNTSPVKKAGVPFRITSSYTRTEAVLIREKFKYFSKPAEFGYLSLDQ
jgi:hypothetical protein